MKTLRLILIFSLLSFHSISQITHQENLEDFSRDKRMEISEWFNYGQSIYDLGGDVSYFRNHLFPDSTVVVEYNTGFGGVWKHSYGQILDPVSPYFSVNNSTPDNQTTYSLDSVALFYRYFRFQDSLPDTLVIQIYEHNDLTFNWDPWSDGRSYARMGYDTTTRKGVLPSSEITYILTNSDTATDNQSYLEFPVGINVAAGNKVGITVTYFPGNPYQEGDTVDAYSLFTPANQINAFIIYDYRDNDKTIDPDFTNNGCIASSSVRYNYNANGWNGKYVPGNAYSAGYYYLDAAFKISFSNSLSMDESNSNREIGTFPNPVTSERVLNIENRGQVKLIYQIYTLEGKRLKTGHSNSPLIQLNCQEMESGIYLLEITNESNSVQRSKFVVH